MDNCNRTCLQKIFKLEKELEKTKKNLEFEKKKHENLLAKLIQVVMINPDMKVHFHNFSNSELHNLLENYDSKSINPKKKGIDYSKQINGKNNDVKNEEKICRSYESNAKKKRLNLNFEHENHVEVNGHNHNYENNQNGGDDYDDNGNGNDDDDDDYVDDVNHLNDYANDNEKIEDDGKVNDHSQNDQNNQNDDDKDAISNESYHHKENDKNIKKDFQNLKLSTTVKKTLLKKNPKSNSNRREKQMIEKFDDSKFLKRHMALQIMYLGKKYHGFSAQARDNKTIEGELFSALREQRLISCNDDVKNLSYPNFSYARCGRTDKGVNAHFQVISLVLRSRKRLSSSSSSSSSSISMSNSNSNQNQISGQHKKYGHRHPHPCNPPRHHHHSHFQHLHQGDNHHNQNPNLDGHLNQNKIQNQSQDFEHNAKFFEQDAGFEGESQNFEFETSSIMDDGEFDYVGMLNRILPKDIRVCGACNAPPQFNARFDCLSREYLYFFVNDNYNIEAMKEGARKFLGEHDFRNFCRMDAVNVKNYQRTVYHFHILPYNHSENWIGKEVWVMKILGSAFLWHQVRCMVAILFLIGKNLEKPNVIDDLLDLNSFPKKPQYLMAEEFPLVLHKCIFKELKFQRSSSSFLSLQAHVHGLLDKTLIKACILHSFLNQIKEWETKDFKETHVKKEAKYVPIRIRETEPSFEERLQKMNLL